MELRGRRDEDLAGAVALLARVHALDGYPSRWPEDPAGWLRASGSRGAWVVLAGTEDPAAAGDVLGHVALVDRAPGRGLASDAPVEVVRLFVPSPGSAAPAAPTRPLRADPRATS